MVYVDMLSIQLFTLTFAALLIFYTVVYSYLSIRKGKSIKELSEELKAASFPLFLLGMFMIITGLFGDFLYPLPGSYNMLFYDMYIMFGLILFSTSLAMYYKQPRAEHYIGFFALMAGAVLLLYGVSGYNLGMTSSPLGLLGLYASFGLAGIFAYPFMFLDAKYLLGKGGKKINKSMLVFGIIFLFFIICGAFIAAYIGGSSVPAHLANIP